MGRRTNCLLFALALFWWRWRRWCADERLPEPILQFRPSRLKTKSGKRVNVFHALVATHRGGDRYSTVSWKPLAEDKPKPLHSLAFEGRVRRGDDRVKKP